MSRKWNVSVWVSILALSLVAAGGCKKKPPITEPEEIEVVQETAPEAPPVPAPTAPPIPPDELTQAMQGKDAARLQSILNERGLVADVYFDYDQYELKPAARDRLAKNAEWMKANPNVVFSIEGHCDERGTNEYNLALGEKRASTAVSYLSRLGTSTSGISTISYGEERPTCMTSAESCWSQNRRAHFVVVAVN